MKTVTTGELKQACQEILEELAPAGTPTVECVDCKGVGYRDCPDTGMDTWPLHKRHVKCELCRGTGLLVAALPKDLTFPPKGPRGAYYDDMGTGEAIPKPSPLRPKVICKRCCGEGQIKTDEVDVGSNGLPFYVRTSCPGCDGGLRPPKEVPTEDRPPETTDDKTPVRFYESCTHCRDTALGYECLVCAGRKILMRELRYDSHGNPYSVVWHPTGVTVNVKPSAEAPLECDVCKGNGWRSVSPDGVSCKVPVSCWPCKGTGHKDGGGTPKEAPQWLKDRMQACKDAPPPTNEEVKTQFQSGANWDDPTCKPLRFHGLPSRYYCDTRNAVTHIKEHYQPRPPLPAFRFEHNKRRAVTHIKEHYRPFSPLPARWFEHNKRSPRVADFKVTPDLHATAWNTPLGIPADWKTSVDRIAIAYNEAMDISKFAARIRSAVSDFTYRRPDAPAPKKIFLGIREKEQLIKYAESLPMHRMTEEEIQNGPRRSQVWGLFIYEVDELNYLEVLP